jgi:hypothetical protein
MKKLSKATLKLRDEIASRLRDRKDDLEKAVEAYNAAVIEANGWKEGGRAAIEERPNGKTERGQLHCGSHPC